MLDLQFHVYLIPSSHQIHFDASPFSQYIFSPVNLLFVKPHNLYISYTCAL